MTTRNAACGPIAGLGLLIGTLHGQCTLPAPTGVQTTPQCSGVSVRWNAVSFAPRYQVYRTPTSAPLVGIVNLGQVTTTTFLDTTIPLNQTWWYWVQTWCVSGAGGTTLTGVPGTRLTAPATPSAVNASDGSSCGEVTVTWSSVADATSYRVFRSTSTTMPTTPLATVGASPFGDTTATPGTVYRYWVQSVNACNPLSPQGSPAGGPDTGSRFVALTAPSGVSASDGTSCQSVRITWSGVSGASGYEISRNGALLAGNAVSPFDDFGATPGTVYTYSVAATSGLSGCGSSLSFGDPGYRAAIPTTPAGVAVVPGSVCGSLLVTWSPAAGASSHNVWRQGTPAPIANVTGSTFTDVPPAPGSWTYWVDAVNGCGTSPPSVVATGFVGSPSSFAVIGAGCAGTLPVSRLQVLQAACIGTSAQLDIDHLPLNAGILILGLSTTSASFGALPFDLTPLGMPGCTAFVSDSLTFFFTGAANRATVPLLLPNDPLLVGLRLYPQALVFDVPGVNALDLVVSDAGQWTVGG
ncbi:MAG: hypothetical protein AB7O97_20780 [Planctomycetota bacterium]